MTKNEKYMADKLCRQALLIGETYGRLIFLKVISSVNDYNREMDVVLENLSAFVDREMTLQQPHKELDNVPS